MPTYDQNYALARQLLHRIKKNHTCSHDIIPREQLPRLFAVDIAKFQQKFGEERMKSYLLHTKQTDTYSNYLVDTARKCSFPHPIMTVFYAISLAGLGECMVLSSRLVIDMLAMGRADCVMLQVKNHQMPNDPSRDHCIVLFGVEGAKLNTSQLNFSSFLSTLPSTCVVIDALLNYVGPAHHLLEEKAAYYQIFQLQSIVKTTEFDASHLPMAQVIIENAQKLLQSSQLKPMQRSDYAIFPTFKSLFELPSREPSLEPLIPRKGILSMAHPFSFQEKSMIDEEENPDAVGYLSIERV